MAPTPFTAVYRRTLIATVIGLAITGVFGFHHPDYFFQSYLFVYEYFSAIVFGSLGFLLLYLLVGGKWGRPIRRILAATVSTVPWTSVLFIPILIGMTKIYPWATVADPKTLGAHKMIWYGHGFFIGRSIFYLIVLNILAFYALRKIRYELAHSEPAAKSKDVGAIGFLVFFVLLSFAVFDWTMSLEPHWYSSIYGALVLSEYGLSMLAFSIIILNWLSRLYPEKHAVDPEASLDLGNLLLATTMFWTYMSISQYIIIWSGNLPEEISWYIARRDGGWRAFTTVVFGGQFAYSFAILLGMERKRALQRLARIAWWVMAIRVLDTFWMVTPDYHPGKIVLHWTDLGLFLAMGGIWLTIFFGRLKKEAAV